jgi:glycosyltransferase involved in cell wall biosynthesis
LHLFVTLPVGGAETLLLNTLRHLDQNKFSSQVCCIVEQGALGERIDAMGIPLVELNLRPKIGAGRGIVSALVKLCVQEKIGLIHSHLYHANYYGRLAARRAGIPAIASIHNTYKTAKLHRRLINMYLARHTAAILVGSEDVRRDVLRFDRVPESLVEIIPNSVDITQSGSALSRAEARKALGLPEKSIVLGSVGRLEEQKGHRHLIEAMHALVQQGTNAHLLLIGDGRERPALEHLIGQLGLGERVLLLGTRNDLGDLFRAMDLFIMPSLWEGLSLAMLSAMAAELPVIATSVGGVRQVMGEDEYGFVIPPGDVPALVAKIRDCLENRERTRLRGILGAQRVRERYSTEAATKRLEALYIRVLENHSPTPSTQ